MNSQQFRALSRRYSIDCEALLTAARWSSAYYLARYAVECGLKACVANEIRSGKIPEKHWVANAYTHDLVKLVKAAGIMKSLEQRKAQSRPFRQNWEEVAVKWTSESRYSGASKQFAEEMVQAVNDKSDGVLPWLKNLW